MAKAPKAQPLSGDVHTIKSLISSKGGKAKASRQTVAAIAHLLEKAVEADQMSVQFDSEYKYATRMEKDRDVLVGKLKALRLRFEALQKKEKDARAIARKAKQDLRDERRSHDRTKADLVTAHKNIDVLKERSSSGHIMDRLPLSPRDSAERVAAYVTARKRKEENDNG